MNSTTSKDGTRITYDREGEGPIVIIVDGALCTRSSGSKPELVKLLAQHFTVYSYDRRGRGDSGDTKPYAIDREIEDIEALIDATGKAANLYGHSSGAALALEAALRLGNKVSKLAMFEAPYNDDREEQQAWREYIRQLTMALEEGRSGDAVALFMNVVGMSPEQIEGMRQTPAWPALEAIAPTLAYDHAAILGANDIVPAERAANVQVPTLVMNGGDSFPFMYHTARTLSKAIPNAQMYTLEGQSHNVSPEALAPVLVKFFTSAR